MARKYTSCRRIGPPGVCILAAVLAGLYGRPWIDLEPHLDLAPLDAIHDEIGLALTQVPVDYTGGSHRSMGIVPPSLANEPWVDYGEVIRDLSDAQFEVFRSL